MRRGIWICCLLLSGAENAAAAELIISSTESNNGSTSTSASDTETEVPLTADQINASRSKTLPTILETHPTVPALPYQTENDWTVSAAVLREQFGRLRLASYFIGSLRFSGFASIDRAGTRVLTTIDDGCYADLCRSVGYSISEAA